MGCCGENRAKSRCGTITPASCVKYEGVLPEWSNYVDDNCASIEDVTGELYDEVDQLKEDISIGAMDGCVMYDKEVDGTVKISTAVKKHSELICELLGAGDPSGLDVSPDISRWGLDLRCLVDECDNPPSTLKQLLQLLINYVCGNLGLYSLSTPFTTTSTDTIPDPEVKNDNQTVNSDPDWKRTGIIETSSATPEFTADVNGQYLFYEEQDINPESETFSQFRWVPKI